MLIKFCFIHISIFNANLKIKRISNGESYIYFTIILYLLSQISNWFIRNINDLFVFNNLELIVFLLSFLLS